MAPDYKSQEVLLRMEMPALLDHVHKQWLCQRYFFPSMDLARAESMKRVKKRPLVVEYLQYKGLYQDHRRLPENLSTLEKEEIRLLMEIQVWRKSESIDEFTKMINRELHAYICRQSRILQKEMAEDNKTEKIRLKRNCNSNS